VTTGADENSRRSEKRVYTIEEPSITWGFESQSQLNHMPKGSYSRPSKKPSLPTASFPFRANPPLIPLRFLGGVKCDAGKKKKERTSASTPENPQIKPPLTSGRKRWAA